MARGPIALALILSAASALGGQGTSPRVEGSIPATIIAGRGVASTMITGVLTEGNRRDNLLAGFPTAIRARLELLKRNRFGFFEREADYDWDVIVDYSPATKLYHLRRVISNRAEDLGEVASIDAAEQVLRKPFSPPLSPSRPGSRYFYLFTAEVSSLSISDLEAWQRWLRGDAEPAVRGKKNPIGVFQRGLGFVFSRMLGGDTQTYEWRSAVFTAG